MPKIDRQAVYNKFIGRCAYCGRDIAYKDMQVDHIKPKRAVERAGNKVYEWERLGVNAMVCGQCGKGLSDEHGYGFVLYEFDYCPFCGAKMNKKTCEGGVTK